MDTEVRNIYPEEQKKLDADLNDEIELALKIQALLKEYSFAMEPALKNGMPYIKFTKK